MAILVWPVDHPFVQADTVRRVVDLARPDRIVIPEFEHSGGHPTAFGRDRFDELRAAVDHPEGARLAERLAVDDLPAAGDGGRRQNRGQGRGNEQTLLTSNENERHQ